MLKARDLAWLLAYPLYQVLGTVRHEASHALLARLEGARVREFVFLPRIEDGLITWGYVRCDGPVTWITTAAPYFVDLLTFIVFFVIQRRPHLPRWLWLNLVVIGLVSPLLNSAYAYQNGFWRPSSDVGRLLHTLPPLAVHLYFGATILGYVAGLTLVFRGSRVARPAP
jgi:hypothetical protein